MLYASFVRCRREGEDKQLTRGPDSSMLSRYSVFPESFSRMLDLVAFLAFLAFRSRERLCKSAPKST